MALQNSEFKKTIIDFLLSETLTTGLCSQFLIEQLMSEEFFDRILKEIKNLEHALLSTTKKAEKFKHPLLQNFFHKHYTLSSFMAKNVGLEMKVKCANSQITKGSEIINKNLLESINPKEISIRIGNQIANLFHERKKESRLTGEWIIYAKHKGHNYYLMLQTHVPKIVKFQIKKFLIS